MLPVQSSTTDFTWAVWANRSVDPADASQRSAALVGNRYAAGGTNANITGDSGGLQFAKITVDSFEYRNNATSNVAYDALSINEWHHYAVVKEDDTFTMYLDGVATGPATAISSYTSVPMPFAIGGDSNSDRGTEFFAGPIDDVMVYDNPLSASEVAALAVPEPTSSLLGAFGLGFFFIRRRR